MNIHRAIICDEIGDILTEMRQSFSIFEKEYIEYVSLSDADFSDLSPLLEAEKNLKDIFGRGVQVRDFIKLEEEEQYFLRDSLSKKFGGVYVSKLYNGAGYIKKSDTEFQLITAEGTLLDGTVFESATTFKDGYSFVKVRDNPFELEDELISIKGQRMLNTECSFLYETLIGDNLIAIYFNKEDELYFLTNLNGATYAKTAYKKIYPCKEGVIRLERYDGKGFEYRKSDGSLLLDRKKKFVYATDFSEGAAVVSTSHNGGQHFIDKQGNELFPGKTFLKAEPFSCGRALVREFLGGQYFIDREGNRYSLPYKVGLTSYEEGTCVVKKDGKNYLFDLEGKEIKIKEKLVFISHSIRGYRLVKRESDSMYNVIDSKGRILFVEWYLNTKPFSGGFFAVKVRGDSAGWNFCDIHGNYLLDSHVKDVQSFKEGVALVTPFVGAPYYIDRFGRKIFQEGV